MKPYALFLVFLVFAAGCTGYAPVEEDQPRESLQTQPGSTQQDAAAQYTSQTYKSSTGVAGNITYTNFQYTVVAKTETVSDVTVTFDRITRSNLYTLTQHMQQILTVEKKGDSWVVTTSPPAKIISETRT